MAIINISSALGRKNCRSVLSVSAYSNLRGITVNKLISLISAVAIGLSVSVAVNSSSDAAIAAEVTSRIAPAGTLCMSGQGCAAAPVAAAPSGPRSGEEIYNSKCSTCHATGAAGAPKYGSDAWAPRIAKGIETLYVSAIGGFMGMPAKGMCFDCSDDEIKIAVDYIVKGGQ